MTKGTNIIIGLLVAILTLTGCDFKRDKPEYVEPSISFAVPKQIALSDMEKEQVAEAQKVEAARLAEEARKAEEARLAEEARKAEEARVAEEKRIADLEAENQRIQKEAEEAEKARIAEIERQQEEANRQLAERLEREKAKTPPPAPKTVPAPPVVPQWIAQAMQNYNYYAPANTVFLMTSDMGGCTGMIENVAGCTTIYADGRIEIRLASQDEFVLIHEIAHTLGVGNECEADRIAREKTGRDVYPNCPR